MATYLRMTVEPLSCGMTSVFEILPFPPSTRKADLAPVIACPLGDKVSLAYNESENSR